MSKLSDKIGQFVTIPHSVIRLWPQISVDGMALFLYLRYRTHSATEIAFPGYDLIARETGLTRRRIAKAIRRLEKAEILERKRRFGASTLYMVRLPPISTPVALMDESDTAPLVQHLDYISPPVELSLVQGVHANKIESIKTESNRPKGRGRKAPLPPDLLSLIKKTTKRNLTTKSANGLMEDVCALDPPFNESTADAFLAWWSQNDWRGRKGEAPMLRDIVELWPQAQAAPRDGYATYREFVE